MHSHRRLVVAAVLSACFVVMGSASQSTPQSDPGNGDSSRSEAASQETAEPPASTAVDENTREEVLQWLNQYLTTEVLFRKEDIQALREKIAQMSPVDLQQWLDQTQEIRDTLDSEQWKSTRIWLQGYLPTQLYTDQEMEQFREDVGKMSPSELLELLKRIQQKHDTIQSIYDAQFKAAVRAKQAQATAQVQQQSRMSWLQSYEKNQAAHP
jgi:hypothetical protein